VEGAGGRREGTRTTPERVLSALRAGRPTRVLAVLALTPAFAAPSPATLVLALLAVPLAALGFHADSTGGRICRALAIACAVGATFIRVNVHAGAVVADQGLVQSDAYATLRDRRLLGADVKIFADVGGKHAVPLAPVDLEQHARDLTHRGLADGLVVSGQATGAATALADVKRVRGAVPGVPLLVGSGATAETAAELLSVADGLIVGTALKRGGDVTAAVDPERVRRLVAAAR